MAKHNKTHKGVARRFKVTGTGKIVHARAGRRHLLTGKSSRKMRPMRHKAQVSKEETRMLRSMMPK